MALYLPLVVSLGWGCISVFGQAQAYFLAKSPGATRKELTALPGIGRQLRCLDYIDGPLALHKDLVELSVSLCGSETVLRAQVLGGTLH